MPFLLPNQQRQSTEGTTSEKLEDFVEAQFYCLHALADGN